MLMYMNGIIKTVLISFAVISTFTACSDKTEIPGPASNSPEDQREYLAMVSKEFTDQLNFTELYAAANEIEELLSYIPEYYSQLDNSAFAAKYSAVYLDGLLSRQHKNYYTDSTVVNDTLILTNIEVYKEFYRLSNITGSFYADVENEKWVCNESSNLEFCYPDSAGNNCILTIKTGGQKTQAYLLQYKNDPVLADSSYLKDNNTIIYNDTTVYVYIDIPENIEITLTKNKKSIFELSIKTDLKEFDVPFDIDNCSFKIESYFKTGSTDFKNSIFYNKDNTDIVCSIKKSGSEILKLSLNTDLTLEGEGLVIAPLKDMKDNTARIKDFDIKPKKLEELSETNADKIDVILTIMNQVDIKVKMKNSAGIVEKINYIINTQVSENDAEYNTISSKIDSVTNEIKKDIEYININYRNGNTEKITLELSYSNIKYIKNYTEYISFKPSYTVLFSDGTKQSFYQYFSPNQFSHLFQLSNQLNMILK